MQELERVQKRAMPIICPGMEYQHALAQVNLPTVAEHHSDNCKRTLESIFHESGHKLRKITANLISEKVQFWGRAHRAVKQTDLKSDDSFMRPSK